MTDKVAVVVDGRKIQFELSPSEAGSLRAASGEAAVKKASKSFEESIQVFGALAAKFAAAFEGQRVSSAEISMGLKITAKGDFIVVGTTGEATLNLKLTITPKQK
jgi:hypothetical protein